MEDIYLHIAISIAVIAAIGFIITYFMSKKKPSILSKRIGKKMPVTPRLISTDGSRLKQIFKINQRDSIVFSIDLKRSSLQIAENIHHLSDLFSSIANIYIICPAISIDEEAMILQSLEDIWKAFMPPSRILFYETDIGKIAFIRQIKPKLFIDYDASVIATLKPHVPYILEYANAEKIIDSLLSQSSSSSS